MAEENTESIRSKYRQHLVDTALTVHLEHDKIVIALSGGALGISMTFLTDFITAASVNYGLLLISAWICWGGSLTSVLWSYREAGVAFRTALELLDTKPEKLDEVWDHLNTKIKNFNYASGLLFVLGILFLAVFAANNLRLL